MYAPVAWVLVSSGTQVQSQIILLLQSWSLQKTSFQRYLIVRLAFLGKGQQWNFNVEQINAGLVVSACRLITGIYNSYFPIPQKYLRAQIQQQKHYKQVYNKDKFIIKTPKRRKTSSSISMVNFELISSLFLVFLLLTLNW